MMFSYNDADQFYLDEPSSLADKYDTILEVSSKWKKIKAQMLVELRSKGVDTTSRILVKPELVKLCNGNNIPISITTQNINQGTCGRPEGMLYVFSVGI